MLLNWNRAVFLQSTATPTYKQQGWCLAVAGRNSWLSDAAPLRGKTTTSEKLQRSQCTEETSLPGKIYLPACPPSALNNVCSDFQPKVTCSTRAPLHFQPPLPWLALTYKQGYLLKSMMWTQPAKMSAANVSCVHNIYRAMVRGFFYESSRSKFSKKWGQHPFVGHYVQLKAIWSHSDLYLTVYLLQNTWK